MKWGCKRVILLQVKPGLVLTTRFNACRVKVQYRGDIILDTNFVYYIISYFCKIASFHAVGRFRESTKIAGETFLRFTSVRIIP